MRDAETLDRQGRLDAPAVARIEKRIQTEIERQNQDLAHRLTEIEARYDSPLRSISRRSRIALSLGFVVVFIGAMLEATLGQGFIFSLANEYRTVAPWIFALLLPFVAIGLLWLRKNGVKLHNRVQTKWLFWPVIFPLMVGLSSAAVVGAPLGWLALGGWAIGVETNETLGIVASVGTQHHGSRGCDQYATLQIGKSSARICLDHRLVGSLIRSGDQVVVRGRVSALGTYVEEIRVGPVTS